MMAARGRDVRKRLMDAAVELIAERGWSAVSTRLLAERAGVAPGVVHYHFTSLQALLVEAAISVMRDLTKSLVDSTGDAVDRMLASVDALTGHDPMSLLFTETYLASTRDPSLRAAVGAVVADLRRQFAELLAEHGVPGPEETAAVLIAAVDGIVLHRALNPDMAAMPLGPVLRRLLQGGPRE